MTMVRSDSTRVGRRMPKHADVGLPCADGPFL